MQIVTQKRQPLEIQTVTPSRTHRKQPVVASDWQRRQLVRRVARPILKEIARAHLDGRTVTPAALIRSMPLPLYRKRPSVGRALLEMTLTSLRNEGRLPEGLAVA